MNRDASKTNIAPPLAIQSGATRPYRFAAAPASAGAMAPPTISPTSVASPNAVAANLAGTLSVGTSTKDECRDALPAVRKKTSGGHQPRMGNEEGYLVGQGRGRRNERDDDQRRFAPCAVGFQPLPAPKPVSKTRQVCVHLRSTRSPKEFAFLNTRRLRLDHGQGLCHSVRLAAYHFAFQRQAIHLRVLRQAN